MATTPRFAITRSPFEKAPVAPCLAATGQGKRRSCASWPACRPISAVQSAFSAQAPRAGAARRRIGFLGHGIGVYEDLSARENLSFFARIAGGESRALP